jgi:hypothetical protein
MRTSNELPRETWPGLSFPYRLTQVIAALLVVSSLAGLLYGRTGLYDTNAATLPALLGQDALALLFGVPLLLGSAWLARRGSIRGLLCWMGLLFYVGYFWYFYVVGIKFSPLFIVHIALVSMSVFGLLYLLFSTDLQGLKERFDSRMPVRLIGSFLMATALAFAALWVGLVATAVVKGHDLDATTRFVIAIDGVVLLPLSFSCGLWIWRRDPLGYAVAGLLLVKMVATFLTLMATTIVSVWWGVPADGTQTVMYAAGLALALWLLIVCLRSVSHEGIRGSL